MITFIYGPQATGKTFHKQAFARRFACSHIVDEWDAHRDAIPDDRRLVLTLAPPPAIVEAMLDDHCPASFQIISISDARVAIGETAEFAVA